MSRFFPALRCLALCICLPSAQAAQQANRGLTITPHDTGESVELYSDSQALVIGASRYGNGWTPLRGVPGDCDAVSKALEAHGFNVTRVTDPDRDGILNALNTFRGKHGLSAQTRLVIYFAGHGHSLDDEFLGETGYIVPVNAPLPAKDPDGFLRTAIELSEIEGFAKRLRSKHVLFVFDSCFAGTIFTSRAASTIPRHITDKTTRPVRQFITAGDANETVPDMSIFRRYFVRALAGEGDLNGDGFVTGLELGEYLHRWVTEDSAGAQHPRAGRIRDVRFNMGDFVFRSLRRKKISHPAPSKPKVLHVNKNVEKAASEYGKGLDALLGRAGHYDFPAAGRHFTRSAEGGHLRAAALVADMYYMGLDGGGEDHELAWRLAQAPASEGDVYARFLVAKLQFLGRRGPEAVERGKEALLRLLPSLRTEAHKDIHCRYALAYVLGEVVEDYRPAVAALRMSADAGLIVGMNNLGAYYYSGKGVPEDTKEAARWYRKAAEFGYGHAMNNLGFMYDLGAGVPEDDKEAVYWYRKGADLGNSQAMGRLGWMYANGVGVPEDHKEAVRWYRKGADLGNSQAMRDLGWMYDSGASVPEDDKEAARWYRMGADLGNSQAMSDLGFMYVNGTGVSEDGKEAVRWYRKAAELGNSQAMGNLGVMYARGTGVAEDDKEAVRWYRKAADLGNKYAMWNLGVAYEKGAGVLASSSNAKLWKDKAREAGYDK